MSKKLSDSSNRLNRVFDNEVGETPAQGTTLSSLSRVRSGSFRQALKILGVENKEDKNLNEETMTTLHNQLLSRYS